MSPCTWNKIIKDAHIKSETLHFSTFISSQCQSFLEICVRALSNLLSLDGLVQGRQRPTALYHGITARTRRPGYWASAPVILLNGEISVHSPQSAGLCSLPGPLPCYSASTNKATMQQIKKLQLSRAKELLTIWTTGLTKTRKEYWNYFPSFISPQGLQIRIRALSHLTLVQGRQRPAIVNRGITACFGVFSRYNFEIRPRTQ